jgi:hypothetical protein
VKIRARLAWYDMWVGAYWDRDWQVLYLCPLPMVLIEIRGLVR